MVPSNNDLSKSNNNFIIWLIGSVIVLTLWLTTRPYIGFAQDSRFYTVGALHTLMPERYANDLYFQYGSQDQFTIFIKIYAFFIKSFGLLYGNVILTILSELLWLGGAVFFINFLVKKTSPTIYLLAFTVLLPAGAYIFSYGEAFLTPRLASEALALIGLGFILRHRIWLACMALCLAMLLHPLMALPVIALCFLIEAVRKPLLLCGLALAGVLIVYGLAVFGVQPFSRLLISFDPKWLKITEVRDYWCFILKWSWPQWYLTLNPVFLAGLIFPYLKKDDRLLLVLALAVLVLGVVVTLIGGDFLHNVLIVDLQLWRAAWIFSFISHVFFGKILLSYGESKPNGLMQKVFYTEFVSLALAQFSLFFYFLLAPVCIVGIGFYWYERQASSPKTLNLKNIFEVLWILSVTIGSVWILFVTIGLVRLLLHLFSFLKRADSIHILVSIGVCCFAVWVLINLRFKPLKNAVWLALVAFILLGVSIVNWNQMTPWTKLIDTTQPPPADLVAALPAEGTIYWQGDVTAPWFLLRRASAFSCAQGSGVLFSRGTAMAYEKDYKVFEHLGPLPFINWDCSPVTKRASAAQATKQGLIYVCQNQPNLSALVLMTKIPGVESQTWVAPVPFEATRYVKGKSVLFENQTFYIYRCGQVLHKP